MKIREDVSVHAITQLFKKIQSLAGVIPGIRQLFIGPNSSQEGLARDYTHAFIVEFENAKVLDVYLPHPTHQAVAQEIIAACENGLEGVLVLDITCEVNG